jgi:hypothetical protein
MTTDNYLEKLSYWTIKLDNAIIIQDDRLIQKCITRVDYFQMRHYNSKQP